MFGTGAFSELAFSEDAEASGASLAVGAGMNVAGALYHA